jgi:hypothetical protein
LTEESVSEALPLKPLSGSRPCQQAEDYAPFCPEPVIGQVEQLELVGAAWPAEDDDLDEAPHIASMSH